MESNEVFSHGSDVVREMDFKNDVGDWWIVIVSGIWSNYSNLTRTFSAQNVAEEGKSPYFREIQIG